MITLSSDFGSPYPAAMRGVLLDSCTDRLVDISHTFDRGNVDSAAFWLREILPYFPPAIHLVVIDPGVGTDRSVLAVRVGEHAFVGPDNGVLYPVITAFDQPWEAFELTTYEAESSTFHGREVFAPLAAAIANQGVDRLETIHSLEPASTIKELTFPEPTITASSIRATILAIDDFGNAITNIDGNVIADQFGQSVSIAGSQVAIEQSYSFVEPGEPIVTIGSHGNVELAVNDGRGDRYFSLSTYDEIEIQV